MTDSKRHAEATTPPQSRYPINRTIVAYLHNGGTITVEGNEVSIDMLRERFLHDTLVKSMAIYEHLEPHDEVNGSGHLRRLSVQGYLALKALRDGLGIR